MKYLERKINLAFCLLASLSLLFFAACSDVNDLDGSSFNGKGESLVSMSVRLPNGSTPDKATRALTSTDENHIKEIDVLLFKNNKFEYIARCNESDITSGTDEKMKTFTVKLKHGTYDLAIIANARTAVNAADFQGKTKAEAVALLTESMPTDGKWIASPAATGYKPIPMWGDLGKDKTAVTIQENTSITDIKLLRMMARVDVTITADNFKLSSVYVYQYHKTGAIAPLDANLDAATKTKAEKPTLPGSVVTTEGPLEYIGNGVVTDKSCSTEIYLFESQNLKNDGTAKGLLERTCVVVGGKFGTDTEDSFYRVDFSSGSGTKQQFLNILRNHKYMFHITKVAGPGYPDKETAYQSEPFNIEAEVLEWNDADMNEIIFNGQYYVSFSGKEMHFDPWGDALNTHEITVKTNVSDFALFDFVNTAGVGGSWTESPKGTWSNEHFTVKFTEKSSSGDNKEYTITAEAKETAEDDVAREITFNMKGANLSAALKVTQEAYRVDYLLKNSLAASITIGKAKLRMDVEITSTHDYAVVLQSNPSVMITGVYDAEERGTKLDETNIPAATKKIWIEFAENEGAVSRTASLRFKHVDPLSSAKEIENEIVQSINYIHATIAPYKFTTAKVRKTGGALDINVETSIANWTAQVTIGDQTVDAATYLDKVTGGNGDKVKLTLKPWSGTAARTVIVSFVDSSNQWVQSNKLVITQRATTGAVAEELVLAVDENGVLNLDGKGESVLFKWGSTVALSSNAADESVAHMIEWTNPEYAVDASTLTSYDKIAYGKAQGNLTYPDNTDANLKIGHGDPCRFAVKGGVVGKYKMMYWDSANGLFPRGGKPPIVTGDVHVKWDETSQSYIIKLLNEAAASWNVTSGTELTAQARPIRRNNNTGVLEEASNKIEYWNYTTTSAPWGSYLRFSDAQVGIMDKYAHHGRLVRCIKAE